MTTAKITGSAPVLLTKDILKAAAYYRDKLGFSDQSLYGDPVNFAIIRRDGSAIMLAQAEADAQIIPNWRVVSKTWNVYFWVNDAEAIYAEFQNSGAIIDYGLYTTPQNIREFGVRDLDDHDIAFGQLL